MTHADQWPPDGLAPVYEAMTRYAAWYEGDASALATAFNDPSQSNGIARSFFSQDKALYPKTQTFWGSATSVGEANDKVHIPIASSISTKSADLMFSRPPRVTFEDATNQEQLDDYIDNGLFAKFHEAAEIASALGGIYLYVAWDPEFSDKPMIVIGQPERAIPEFKWGKLVAVTFWTIIERDGDKCVRWLERHEPGFIRHNVYEGAIDQLGDLVPLSQFAETADLVEGDEYEAVIETGIDKLTAVYIPNMRPNKVFRGIPHLKDLGESDYANIETLMDRLDREYTNWMKEIRLGKTRLLVDRSVLQSEGKGQGAYFDADRDIFTPLTIGASDENDPIRPFQPELRVQPFMDTTTNIWEQIVTGAGYSTQTFGAQGDIAMTATEVQAREKQTITTRGRKVNYWTVGLKDILEVWTAINAVQYGVGVQENPEIVFPEYVTPQPEELATGISVLVGVKVMSVRTAIAELHPDWDEKQVEDELAELSTEGALEAPETVPEDFGALDGTDDQEAISPADLEALSEF